MIHTKPLSDRAWFNPSMIDPKGETKIYLGDSRYCIYEILHKASGEKYFDTIGSWLTKKEANECMAIAEKIHES